MKAAGFSQSRPSLRYGSGKRRGRESGAIAIMTVGAIIIIICFFALALDLSRLYNRKIELQNAADTLALAAALELNGTDQGIAKALDKAADRLAGPADGALTYNYGARNFARQDTAIRFGPTPDGPWSTSGQTTGRAADFLYVRVDTDRLDEDAGLVETFFTRMFAPDLEMLSTSAHAVAGRSGLNVTPLGICALRPGESHRDHNGELEEFGFRRGVAYNLMQLGPVAGEPARTFLINPRGDAAAATTTTVIAPYVCTGTVDLVRMTERSVPVSADFPLGSVYHHLNSRFEIYNTAPLAPCKSATAPPDANIKQYSASVTGGVAWMSAVTGRLQSAAPSDADGKKWTVASPDTTPAGTTAAMFGPLWAYAKAVRYSSYQTHGKNEPAGGYSTYSTGDWGSLYGATSGSSPAVSSSGYPSKSGENTPYLAKTSSYSREPDLPGVRERRVLNVPLLSCPVSGSSATVLGIGKFFMTVQASGTALHAEFGGLANEASLGTRVELYP